MVKWKMAPLDSWFTENNDLAFAVCALIWPFRYEVCHYMVMSLHNLKVTLNLLRQAFIFIRQKTERFSLEPGPWRNICLLPFVVILPSLHRLGDLLHLPIGNLPPLCEYQHIALRLAVGHFPRKTFDMSQVKIIKLIVAWIPCNCLSFRFLVLCMSAHCHIFLLQLNRTGPSLDTCASFLARQVKKSVVKTSVVKTMVIRRYF